MKSDRHWHLLGGQVFDSCGYLERACLKPVRHFNRVSEWELLHPRRLLVEVEPARNPRRRAICLRFDEPPVRRGGQEPMDRNGAAYIPQRHVKGVSLSVGIEGLLVEPVGPRSYERYPAHRRVGFE